MHEDKPNLTTNKIENKRFQWDHCRNVSGSRHA